MIGGDAIGFHAVAEMITDTNLPAVTYLSVSRLTTLIIPLLANLLLSWKLNV